MHPRSRNPRATPEDVFDPQASPPIVVGLRCDSCGKCFSRKVAWAMVSVDHARRSSDWDGILLSDIVTCLECGAVDDYTIASESRLAFAAQLIAGISDGGQRGRLALGVSSLWDGTIVRRPTQALAHLRWLAETHPESAKAFRCLGNACNRWQRTDEALSAWRRACELDDSEIEAAFSLANHLLGPLENHAEGFFYLRRVVATIPSAVRAGTVSGNIVRAAVGLLESVARGSEDDIALMAAWPSGESRKELVVTVSSVDMRAVRDFDRLADLAEAGHFTALALTPDLPDVHETTHLERLLANDETHEAAPQHFEQVFPRAARHTRSSSLVSNNSVGRNAPCTCGSGRKYKRCCGRR